MHLYLIYAFTSLINRLWISRCLPNFITQSFERLSSILRLG
jgi:hypothetical protein